MKIQQLLTIMSLVLICTGCVQLKEGSGKRSTLPLPHEISQRYEYRKLTDTDNAVMKSLVMDEEYDVRFMELPVARVSSTSNKVLTIEYYLPRRTNSLPLVLLLPISGGRYQLERYQASYLASRGYAVAIVHRESKKERSPTAGLDINRVFNQSVADNMQVIDWLAKRPEIDTNNIFVLGTSLGSLKATLLVAADLRVKAAVFGLTGGDIPYIISHSSEKGVKKKRDEFIAKHHVNVDVFYQGLKDIVDCDPNKMAPYIDRSKLLMVLGIFDTVVPFKKGLELRRNIGKPETLFLFGGHYTSLIYLPEICLQIDEFFRKKMK